MSSKREGKTTGPHEQAQPLEASSESSPDDEFNGRQAQEASSDQAAQSEAAGQAPPSLEAQLAEAKDRGLRLQAELENQRRRFRREMEDYARHATLPLVRDLLPVIDNLERAIAAAEQSPEAAGLLEGVKMMSQQLARVLEQHDCRKIEALHEPFDPNIHEAIQQQPTGEHPPGTVVHVAQDGYLLHDRVVRPAQVIVAAPPAGES